MYTDFIDRLALGLNPSKTIKIPLSVKKILWIMSLGGYSYKTAKEYNKTVCFTDVSINGNEISDKRIVVPRQPCLFLYKSQLLITDDAVEFIFSWQNLTRKIHTATNKKLCDYSSAIFGRQMVAILFALSFSQADTQNVVTKIANYSAIATMRNSTAIRVNNFDITISIENSLNIGGKFLFDIKIT